MVGYRIPATDIKAKKQLGQLGHLIERSSTSTSTSTSSKPNKREEANAEQETKRAKVIIE